MPSDPLTASYERYLDDHDEDALLSAIKLYGGFGPPEDLDCPLAHRICDIRISNADFRIVRIYNLDDRSSKLLIYPTDTPGPQKGVPFEMQGDRLHKWVMDELATNDDDAD